MYPLVLGMNHRTAPVEVRERLAPDRASDARSGDPILGIPAVEEALVLATCNRLEVYVVVSRYHEAMEALAELLARRGGMDVSTFLSYVYVHHRHEAARHLFRVASGLDSMVLGEAEILGQVRAAYRAAREGDGRTGRAGKALHELFQRALRVGKRARSETAIGEDAGSLSYAAVQLARERLGSLTGRGVLLVGAGKMAEQAADNLRAQGADAVLFANRTPAHARRLAEGYGGEMLPIDRVEQALARVDIAVVSTSAPGYVLPQRMLERVRRRRGGTPLLLVDLSVPRNVEPAADTLEGVSLYDVDDLEAVIADAARQREREVPAVEAIVRTEVASFSRWLEELHVTPLIRSLREKAEQVRHEEVARLLERLSHLDEREQRMIARATEVIVKKILNEPTIRLKELAAGDHGDHADLYVQALSELFDLPAARAARGADGREGAAGSPPAGGL